MHGPIRLNIELSPEFMVVLVSCKNEEHQIKIEGARVFTTLYFFKRSMADNSGVNGGIWPKFELIQAFIHVLVTYKNEDDTIKNRGATTESAQHFSHYKYVEIFSDAKGKLTLQSLVRSNLRIFELVLDVIDVLVTCENKE